MQINASIVQGLITACGKHCPEVCPLCERLDSKCMLLDIWHMIVHVYVLQVLSIALPHYHMHQ